MTFCLPTLEGYGIKVGDANATALCTVVHGLGPFQHLRVPRGVHRIVIERLLPSQERISEHPPQNANSETNMFRDSTDVRTAKRGQFPPKAFSAFRPGMNPTVLSAKRYGVIR